MWEIYNVRDSVKRADVHKEKNEYNKINMYKTYKSIAVRWEDRKQIDLSS